MVFSRQFHLYHNDRHEASALLRVGVERGRRSTGPVMRTLRVQALVRTISIYLDSCIGSYQALTEEKQMMAAADVARLALNPKPLALLEDRAIKIENKIQRKLAPLQK